MSEDLEPGQLATIPHRLRPNLTPRLLFIYCRTEVDETEIIDRPLPKSEMTIREMKDYFEEQRQLKIPKRQIIGDKDLYFGKVFRLDLGPVLILASHTPKSEEI